MYNMRITKVNKNSGIRIMEQGDRLVPYTPSHSKTQITVNSVASSHWTELDETPEPRTTLKFPLLMVGSEWDDFPQWMKYNP